MKQRLFVIVQGLSGFVRPTNSHTLIERLKAEPALEEVATWYIYPHRPRALGSRGLKWFAKDLAAEINQLWVANDGFEEVVLVGHSVGGLLVRQAYLGAAEPGGSAWAAKVTRIVLLGTPNRGVFRLPLYLRPLHWFLRIFFFWVRLTYQDLMQGSVFVTNLRIEWIRHFRAKVASKSQQLPTIIQLLGTNDNVVYEYDSHDVLAFPDTSYVEVAGATHHDLPQLQTWRGADGREELTEEGLRRYTLLRNAIIGPPGSLGQSESPSSKPTRANFTRVVFILHGIRASEVDDWVSEIAAEIQSEDAQVLVVRPSYGYLSALRFVLPSVRRRNLRWFQDQYAERLAQNPEAEFHFIGHSNGTYMLGQSLKEIPAMEFKRVVLAGSVLPADFFDSQSKIVERNQVAAVRSDAGRFDWPVGILCRVLRQVLWMKDVGTGGYDGFKGGFVEEQYRYHDGGHGGMFMKRDNIKSIVHFVLKGSSEPKPEKLPKHEAFNRLARIAPYFGAIALFLIVVGPWVLHFSGFAMINPISWYVFVVLAVAFLAIVLDVI
jgi:pimeloyl-ACP methyl ester carboxylesterase